MQGELEAALARVLPEPVRLAVAGRTDAGVHALGQVASFEHSAEVPDNLAARLNAVSPRDVVVRSAEAAPDGFDARRDARSRSYLYRVWTSQIPSPFEEGRALWWRYALDDEALAACAAALVGTHDFTAFTPTESSHTRFERDILRAEWWRDGDVLTFRVEARRIHAPHGPRARRDDARGGGGPALARRLRAPARGRTPPRRG